MSDVNVLLDALSKAPDTQIDAFITAKLPNIKTASEMKEILDECAHASLASDFAMATMDIVWKMMLEIENNDSS